MSLLELELVFFQQEDAILQLLLLLRAIKTKQNEISVSLDFFTALTLSNEIVPWFN